MDGASKAILILLLFIGFGVVTWLLLRKTSGTGGQPHNNLCADTLPGYRRMFKGDPCYAKSQDDCDSGYTFMGSRCCKGDDKTGTPTIDPKTGECTRIPKPCNPKDPIKYSVYRYDPSGNCAFSGCMQTYKYDDKTNTCVSTATDPLYLDCMANTADFVKVTGNPRPSDPNKGREWDAGHSGYCDTLTARSPTDTITGKYYNGTCYISINQKCKTYPQMDNMGRFDDSTAGGPKDTSESMCKARVESWKKGCN